MFTRLNPEGMVNVALVLVHVVAAYMVLPSSVTVPLPDGSKLLPVTVTVVPARPELGLTLVITGGTINERPLLCTPPAALTNTLPVVAPEGTTAVMLVLLHDVIELAGVPLKVTAPLPCDEPKLVPAITIDEFTAPALGDKLVMLGADVAVNVTPLLCTPPAAVTTTLPVVAPEGTTAVMPVLFHDDIEAAGVPLNVTVPLPCDEPKFVPAITIAEFTAPAFGVRLLMFGDGVTVNDIPLLCTPPAAVTTTLPVVAPDGATAVLLVLLHDVIELAGVPLKVTVPFPCDDPKFVPAITTDEFTAPVLGDKLLTLGPGVTVNVTPLLCTPPGAVNTKKPVFAPGGTTAVTLVGLHDVMEEAGVPLNVTVPLPCDDPKFVPAITIDEFTAPALGLRLLTLGAGVTVNDTPLLCTPPAAVTTTLPEVAEKGTTAVMLVLVHGPIAAAVMPLIVTVPLPCDEPKFVPVITIVEFTAPVFGLRLLTLGAAVTVNVTPLLCTPPAAVTTTLPVVAPEGATAVILVALHDVMEEANMPLNVTLPFPCNGPKFVPAITIDEFTAPVFGLRLLMLGADVTVNVTPLLCTPPAAVTTTFPVAAPEGTTAVMLVLLHDDIDVADMPLNVTLPFPCDGPKFVPAITIDELTAPVLGVRLLMLGAAVTVNSTPLLALPLTVTTTLPVVAVLGTVAVMLFELKLVIVAVLLLNVTVALDWFVPKLLPAITTDDPMAPVFGVRLLIVGAAAAAREGSRQKDSTQTADNTLNRFLMAHPPGTSISHFGPITLRDCDFLVPALDNNRFRETTAKIYKTQKR